MIPYKTKPKAKLITVGNKEIGTLEFERKLGLTRSEKHFIETNGMTSIKIQKELAEKSLSIFSQHNDKVLSQIKQFREELKKATNEIDIQSLETEIISLEGQRVSQSEIFESLSSGGYASLMDKNLDIVALISMSGEIDQEIKDKRDYAYVAAVMQRLESSFTVLDAKDFHGENPSLFQEVLEFALREESGREAWEAFEKREASDEDFKSAA